MSSEGGEFLDDFGENGFFGLVGVDGDEQPEVVVDADDGHGFGAEFLDTSAKNFRIAVVGAAAAVLQDLDLFPAGEDIGFGNVEQEDGFDFVTGGLGRGYDGLLFAAPAADGAKYEWKRSKVFSAEIRQN